MRDSWLTQADTTVLATCSARLSETAGKLAPAARLVATRQRTPAPNVGFDSPTAANLMRSLTSLRPRAGRLVLMPGSARGVSPTAGFVDPWSNRVWSHRETTMSGLAHRGWLTIAPKVDGPPTVEGFSGGQRVGPG